MYRATLSRFFRSRYTRHFSRILRTAAIIAGLLTQDINATRVAAIRHSSPDRQLPDHDDEEPRAAPRSARLAKPRVPMLAKLRPRTTQSPARTRVRQ
jgi:hypothetical protein